MAPLGSSSEEQELYGSRVSVFVFKIPWSWNAFLIPLSIYHFE